MEMTVCRKRELFRIWKYSQNEEDRKNGYGSESLRGSGEG